MRIITPKDKQALLIAFRVFVRALNGERISQKAGDELMDRFLDSGVSFDALFNKENWARVSAALGGTPTAKDYVEMLGSRQVEVRDLAKEPLWHDNANGFNTVAEATHDFFMEVTGRGGKWNIPSALTNLAKAIREHTLQAVMSEELILRVVKDDDKMGYFGYIQAIARDFNSLGIDTSPTEAQARRAQEDEDTIRMDAEKDGDAPAESLAEEATDAEGRPVHIEESVHETVIDTPGQEGDTFVEDDPEDEPFPDDTAPGYEPETDFESQFLPPNPRDLKRDSIKLVLENYTPKELMGIVRTIEGGDNLPVSQILDRLTDGLFDVSKETAETRQIHQGISSDLMPEFINCARTNGVQMDDELAGHYDILHDSWDLRTVEVRKLFKLKRLVALYGKDDSDLSSALADIEQYYSQQP